MKKIYSMVFMALVTIIVNFSSEAGTVKSWGSNIVNQGRSFGFELVSAGFLIAGVLFVMGVSFAGQLMSKVLIGGAMIFGAGTLATLIRNIFN